MAEVLMRPEEFTAESNRKSTSARAELEDEGVCTPKYERNMHKVMGKKSDKRKLTGKSANANGKRGSRKVLIHRGAGAML